MRRILYLLPVMGLLLTALVYWKQRNIGGDERTTLIKTNQEPEEAHRHSISSQAKKLTEQSQVPLHDSSNNPALPPEASKIASTFETPSKSRGTVTDGMRDQWFALYRGEFESEPVRVEGIVTSNYNGSKAKFKVQMLLPPLDFEGSKGTAIFLEDVQNPDLRLLGGASFDGYTTDTTSVVIRDAAAGLHDFFSPNNPPTNGELFQGPELRGMSLIYYTIDINKVRSRSTVEARFNFNTTGPTTKIGGVLITQSPNLKKTNLDRAALKIHLDLGRLEVSTAACTLHSGS